MELQVVFLSFLIDQVIILDQNCCHLSLSVCYKLAWLIVIDKLQTLR